MMHPLFRFLFTFLCIPVLFTGQSPDEYDLSRPVRKTFLPPGLHEISGISVLDSTALVGVQDENGYIFTIQKSSLKVTGKVMFAPDGDYEGIAVVDELIYVLRSDGVLFEVAGNNTGRPAVKTYTTNIPAVNNEGLCYDKENNRLLIGCKSKPGKGPEYKNLREIYAFDLTTRKLIQQPAYSFNVESLKKYALDHQIKLPLHQKKKGPAEHVLRFATSAIAIHPISGKLYLLSSADKLLFVFNNDGSVEHVRSLPPDLFNKPEGIIFFGNGDMVITNEGQDKKPTLLIFEQ